MSRKCKVERGSLGDMLWQALPSASRHGQHLAEDAAPARSLKTKLEGELVILGNWTCADGCKPPHEEEVKTPGTHEHCLEKSTAGQLQLREDFDLGCMGSNMTCEDIETNETLQAPEKLYTNCDLDQELLQGECTHFCRFDRHPTRRCDYYFDRNNKYGMHGHEGMYGFGHCVWYAGCSENSTTDETNYLVCNTTETHEILHGSTSTLRTSTSLETSTTTSTTTFTTTSPTTTLVPAVAPPLEDSGFGVGVIIGAAAGGAAVVCILAVLLWFFLLRRRKSHENPVHATGTVVVGRPVPGVAPPAGFGKDDKVENDKVEA